MCMEDIRIGRKSPANTSSVTVGLTSTPILPANDKRTGIVFSSPVTNRVTLTPNGPAVLDSGVNLYPGQVPVQLTLDTVGQAVCQAWYGITTVGSQAIGVIETMYPSDDAPSK